MKFDENYWTARYSDSKTGWDVGEVTAPLKEYFDQLNDKNITILIPGAGNAYEVEYLYTKGFTNVYLADISSVPIENFQNRCPGFPKRQLLHVDFFEIRKTFDLIIEQTFFSALEPSQRLAYAKKVYQLLKPGGRLVGVLFEDKFGIDEPPFGGEREEYRKYFEPFFDFHTYETAYNSIPPRTGRELFINLVKKI
jgi:methyl halide transferase